MKLFTIGANRLAEISAECRLIPEFKRIIVRDKDRDKKKAMKELTFIYFYTDYQSPYSSLEEDSKIKEAKYEARLDDNWKIDEDIEAAIKKYESFQETDNIKLLKAARVGLYKLIDYFKDTELTERDDKGKLVNKASDMSNNIANLAKLVQGLTDLEKQVKREISDGSSIRGSVQVNKYSQ